MQDLEDDEPGRQRLNGHRPHGVMPKIFGAAGPALPSPEDMPFDVAAAAAAVVGLHTEIPADAYTAEMLGTEREGSGIVIDDDGLILTIGYLVLEAMAVSVQTADGEMLPAEVVGYDHETGFGLVRPLVPLPAPALDFGSATEVQVGNIVLVIGHGGEEARLGAFVVDKREFAGYWEYLLDEAIFTSPPHRNWGGTALLGRDGRLIGVGSLYVEEASPPPDAVPGNMFVPIDLLPPILPDLIAHGRSARPPVPWLGMFATDNEGRIDVIATAEGGPAARQGVQAGDSVIKVGERVVNSVAEMYRAVRSVGPAGATIPLTVLRGSMALRLEIVSEDRYRRLKFHRDL